MIVNIFQVKEGLLLTAPEWRVIWRCMWLWSADLELVQWAVVAFAGELGVLSVFRTLGAVLLCRHTHLPHLTLIRMLGSWDACPDSRGHLLPPSRTLHLPFLSQNTLLYPPDPLTGSGNSRCLLGLSSFGMTLFPSCKGYLFCTQQLCVSLCPDSVLKLSACLSSPLDWDSWG